MDIFEQIKKISPRELENAGVIRPAKKLGYVCPFCGNGTGDNGDGLSVTEQAWGYNYKCFGKCEGANYTAVDLIKKHYRLRSMREVAEKAKEEFRMSDFSSFNGNKKADERKGEQKTESPKNYDAFYKKVQNRLASKEKIEIRGFNFEDLAEVGAGLSSAADLKSVGEGVPQGGEYLILPYNSGRFFIRQVNKTAKGSVKRGNTGGKKTSIYNPYKIDFCKAFFVVEGELDAIAIHKAGFPVVALSGAGEYKLLIRTLEGLKMDDKSEIKAILLLDGDEAGRKSAKTAEEEMRSDGYGVVNFILSTDYDANEFMQKDFSGFCERLKEIYEQAKAQFLQMVGGESLYYTFDTLDDCTAQIKNSELKWGFPILDDKMSLLPGNYLLGALPSMGKTAFALQVATNVCEQEKAVLYVSYEPTNFQIAFKDLARYWFMQSWGKNANADFVPSAKDLMLGKYTKNAMFTEAEMKKVRAKLRERRKNFYFLQGRMETADELVSKVKKFVDYGVRFVVIDYIQLIKGTDPKKTVREQIDETVRKLQIFQSQNNLAMLFISSFNRENYRKYASLESFKESGGLEYTADGMLALQFDSDDGTAGTDLKGFQEMKQQQPRNIELVCLKNRWGMDFVDKFAYHSKHETFFEKDASKVEQQPNNEEWDDD